MQIDIKNAVKTFFPQPSLMQVIYEAVANAFDASACNIHIKLQIDKLTKPNIVISITDDGLGFNESNFQQFSRLLVPVDKDHKGLGRLVFLEYFDKVAYESMTGTRKRSFVFTSSFEGECDIEDCNSPSGTKITFSNFIKRRISSYDDVKPDVLRQRIFEQFMPLLYKKKSNGTAFRINIDLITAHPKPEHGFQTSATILDADFLPDLKVVEIPDVPTLGSIHAKYRIDTDADANKAFVAVEVEGRTIDLKIIEPARLPPACQLICLFQVNLFTLKTDHARQQLTFDNPETERNIRRVLRQQIAKILDDNLPSLRAQNEQTRERMAETYPHLQGYFKANEIGLIDEEITLAEAQAAFFYEQREVLESDSLDEDTFNKSLELSSRVLTEYVLYRHFILKKMKQFDPQDDETSIHDLIVPRYKRYQKEDFAGSLYQNNAWILDDKFMDFNAILSERYMHEVVQEITGGSDKVGGDGRPDIVAVFSADPSSQTKVDVVLVELKKRNASYVSNTYVIPQILERARRLVDHCPNIQRVWYFGIIDIDADFERLLEQEEYTPLYSQGQMWYREYTTRRLDTDESVPTPIYLSSFETLLSDAEARNSTFLKVLKENIKRFSS